MSEVVDCRYMREAAAKDMPGGGPGLTRALAERQGIRLSLATGIRSNACLEEDRPTCLVGVAVPLDGRKGGAEDGYREFTESWASLL